MIDQHAIQPMQSDRKPNIATARAEILELIEALRLKRRASEGPVAPRTTGWRPERVPAGEYRDLVERVRESQRRLRRRKSHSSIPPDHQALEKRVLRLEERVYAPKQSVRPAALATADTNEEWTFEGVIQGQMVSDMLQLVSSNSMTGLFLVQNETERCELFFDEGKMVHAAAKDVEGEKAFFSAFALEQGTYHFRETTELPEKRSITGSTQFLILEALRQIDEAQGE
jgi:Domain of unknown function (DUF4388)